CRLSTGGGWSTRELYSDFDEALFEARRPVLLNGITDVVTEGDLLDRTLGLDLLPIPEERRRPEAELWAAFERPRPRILGGLLDTLSGMLRELDSVKLDRLPRMADFALLAVAAERASGAQEVFLDAYAGARAEADEQAI